MVFLLFVLVSGCAKTEQPSDPIKIGIDVFPGWAHAFIAQEKGFFEKNNVRVELVLNPDYLEVQKQFANGELDAAFMVYADAIYADSNGIPTNVVYISDHSVTADVIAAKPEYKTLEDLRGKVIGVEGVNSFSHLFVLSALEKKGVKEGDIFVENMGAQEVVDALEQGQIVAGHTYGPGKTKAAEKGYVFLAFSGDVKGIITDTLAFHTKTIEERPEEIKAILKSLFEAKQFQETSKEEAMQILANALSDTPGSIAAGVSDVQYLDLEQNAAAMKKDEELTNLYGSGKLISDFWISRGQISKLPDFDALIEESFVNDLLQESTP